MPGGNGRRPGGQAVASSLSISPALLVGSSQEEPHTGRRHTYIQSSPYFDPTHTRTGWIGQPPILNRHEVVTIDGDVDTLGQATP